MNRFLVLLAFVFSAAFAQAAYLMWQVDAGDYGSTGMTATEASLYQVGNSTALATTGAFGTPVQVDIGSLGSGTSFYVELVNWSSSAGSEVVARSGEYTYESLSGSIMTTTLSDMPNVTPWHAGNYKAVPEPTSGFLMMVGLALLGLKRRKA